MTLDLVDGSTLGAYVGHVAVCTRCGAYLTVGMWPVCDLARGKDHGPSVQTSVFSTYFDVGLGVEVSSLGDRRRLMKEGHLDYRDKMRPGELSARNDRIAERKREEMRR